MASQESEPIAIIGMASRFPGDATSVDQFWRVVCEGRSCLSRVPADRFNVDAFYHEDTNRTDTINTKHGHFVRHDLAKFDAQFFGVSPQEATSMDPQHRGLLETTYHALENAGIPMEQVAGSRTSVYVATPPAKDYENILSHDLDFMSKHHALGVGPSLLANRISHFFDLRGPSLTLDTACSSSLYAIHLACQSISCGESYMSIVGGANVTLSPESFLLPLSSAGFLSSRGSSRSFDDSADGYGRGEGFAAVVLKPLGSAVRDGDNIRSVIRATAVNTDGRTPSLTAPSQRAQMELIRDTYHKARLDMAQTSYVEAHGTGTIIGDPIEANALGETFSKHRSASQPLFIGAVKSSIGHLESVSGLAALIKTTLVLETGLIPPIVWLKTLNPNIQAERYHLKFPTILSNWPSSSLRRASINSFGYGGANSHAILDDARSFLEDAGMHGYHYTVPAGVNSSPQTYDPLNQSTLKSRLLILSAADRQGVDRQKAALYLHYKERALRHENSAWFERLCYTLSERRTKFRWRSFAVVQADSFKHIDIAKSFTEPSGVPGKPIAIFVFTGQGAQWPRSCRELFGLDDFRKSIEAADTYLSSIGCAWSVKEELQREDGGNLNQPVVSQTMSTVLQIGIVDTLFKFEVSPSFVIGHSSGEIAAAYSCGSISRQAAWGLAYMRGIAAGRGATDNDAGPRQSMLAVSLSEEEARAAIQHNQLEASVSIGCINSPISTTLSGLEESLEALRKELSCGGIYAKFLPVNRAYHSAFMESSAQEYDRHIRSLDLSTVGSQSRKKTLARLISTLRGKEVHTSELSQPDYWVENLRSPVLFSEAVLQLLATANTSPDSFPLFIEVGPSAVLRRPLSEAYSVTKPHHPLSYTSVLRHQEPPSTTLLNLAGHLFISGLHIRLDLLNGYNGNRVQPLEDLPLYVFNHSQSYWFNSRLKDRFRFRREGKSEFLGTKETDWNSSEPRWRHVIKAADYPWVEDHKIRKSCLYPGAGFLVMAIEALRQTLANEQLIEAYHLRDVRYIAPLSMLESKKCLETRVSLFSKIDGQQFHSAWFEFRVYGLQTESWFLVCCGKIKGLYHGRAQNDLPGLNHLLSLQHSAAENCAHVVHPSDFYGNITASGYHYGSTFRLLKDIKFNLRHNAIANLNIRESDASHESIVHPAILDSIFQVPLVGLTSGGWNQITTALPSRIKEIWLSSELMYPRGLKQLQISSNPVGHHFKDTDHDIIGVDPILQRPLMWTRGFRATALDFDPAILPIKNAINDRRLTFQWRWRPEINLCNNLELYRYLGRHSNHRAAHTVSPESVELCESLVMFYIQRIHKSAELPFTSSKHLQKYRSWMERVYQRNITALNFSQTFFERLLHDIDSQDPCIKAILLVGERLDQIFSGSLDPLQFLFESPIAENFYHHSHRGESIRLAQNLEILAHSNPNLKVLEIGAGTGATTADILEVLTDSAGDGDQVLRFSEYIFTDVSPLFLSKGKARFENYSDRIRYQTLDVTKDPLRQGFEAHSYDVIVAAAVLHAVEDLTASLRNVCKLLKPSGKLLLLEPCDPEVLTGTFVFGTLPGWWLSNDSFRLELPIIQETIWDEVLKRTGFTGLENAPTSLKEETPFSMKTLITSRSSIHEADSAAPASTTLLVRSHKSSSIDSVIVNEIRESGLKVDVLPLPNVSRSALSGKVAISLLQVESNFLQDMDESEFQSLKHVLLDTQHLFWLTRGATMESSNPQNSYGEGLLRTIVSERGQQSVTMVDFGCETEAKDVAQALRRLIDRLRRLGRDSIETQYAYRDLFMSGRIVPNGLLNNRISEQLNPGKLQCRKYRPEDRISISLQIMAAGHLDTLYFEEQKFFSSSLGEHEVDVQVVAAGVSFRDVLVALGRNPARAFGSDCAGIVERAGTQTPFKTGDTVFCFTPNSLSSRIRCVDHRILKIPETVTLHQAAGFGSSFLTAFIAIHRTARVQPQESILIHAAAGGVGQMAVQLAIRLGAVVYATTSTEEKRNLLMEKYGIPRTRISSSRDESFVEDILENTLGQGVDIVLNSLTGPLLQASFRLLKPFGRFVEIGKHDIAENTGLEMGPFGKSTTFASLDLAADESLDLVMQSLEECFLLLDEDKSLHPPMPLSILPAADVERGFRLLQQGKKPGKVLISFEEEQLLKVVSTTHRGSVLDPNSTYVVVGGLGGIGTHIVQWMLACGVRYILILSRSGSNHSSNGAAASVMKEAVRLGARVEAPVCDVSDEPTLRKTLADYTRTFPKIKGCIHGGMVLEHATFEKMSLTTFKLPFAAKVAGSFNLHTLLPKDLDFFIMLSSVIGVYGTHGSSNYAAANSYQDALARYRVWNGQRAYSLNIGLVADVGYVAERPELLEALKRFNHRTITVQHVLATLQVLCNPSLPQPAAPELAQISIGLTTPVDTRNEDGYSPEWLCRPMFRDLQNLKELRHGEYSTRTEESSAIDYKKLIMQADSDGNGERELVEGLIGQISDILGLPSSEVDPSEPFYKAGVDSLLAVEIHHWFYQKIGLDMDTQTILGGESIFSVCREAVERVRAQTRM